MDILSDDILRAILDRVAQKRVDSDLDYLFTCRRWLELDGSLTLGVARVGRPMSSPVEAVELVEQPAGEPGDRLVLARTSVTVREGAMLGEEELLRQLQGMSNLTSLSLRRQSLSHVSDTFFQGIARQFTNLQSLDIPEGSIARCGPITSSGLQALAGVPRVTSPDIADVAGSAASTPPVALPLRKLKLLGCETVQGDDIPPLGRFLPGLLELELGATHQRTPGASEGVLATTSRPCPLPKLFQSLTSLKALFLRHRLRHLPAAIRSLTALQRLTLKAPKLENPLELGTLSCLTFLHIFSSALTSLPDSLGQLLSLRTLELDCKALTSLPDSIGALTALQEVSLKAWSSLPTRLPESFFSLPMLRKLHAGGSLARLADRVPRLAGTLQVLSCRCMYNSEYEDLLASLSLLTHLKSLSFSGAPLPLAARETSSVSGYPLRSLSFQSLTSLQELTLEKLEGISFLPTSLGSLRHLRTLSVSICPALLMLPDSIGNLTSLTDLTISYCGSLRSLPLSLATLPSLTRVLISFCHSLTSLPYFSGAFPALRDLRLYHWAGSSLWEASSTYLSPARGTEPRFTGRRTNPAPGAGAGPEAEAETKTETSTTAGPVLDGPLGGNDKDQDQDPARSAGFANLESLVVSSQEMRRLPSEIGSFRKLRELVLQCDKLKALPDSLCQLSAIRELRISAGSLASFPRSLGSLTALEKLLMEKRGCPRVQNLPETFSDLASLKVLTLLSCPALLQLPKYVSALSNLEELRLGVTESKKAGNVQSGSVGHPARAQDSASLRFFRSVRSAFLSGDQDSGESSNTGQHGAGVLERLPGSLCGLPKLRVLEMEGLDRGYALLQNLGSLEALQVLSISQCSRMGQLPRTMGSLRFLRTLKLSACRKLKGLPEDFRGLRSLRNLHLQELPLLASLPLSLRHATSLSSISLRGLDSLASLSPLEEMQGLVELKIEPWPSLRALPQEILDLPLLSGPARAALCNLALGQRPKVREPSLGRELFQGFWYSLEPEV